MLDFGFSWTASRFVAEALERREDELLVQVLPTSLILYLALGLFGGVGIALLATPVVGNVFNTPASLVGEGTEAARLLALGFPFAMLQTFCRFGIAGARRFDLTAVPQVLFGRCAGRRGGAQVLGRAEA